MWRMRGDGDSRARLRASAARGARNLLLAAILLLALASAASAKPRFRPASGTTWQWQLTTPVDTKVPAEVYDIDGYDNSASVVARLHRLGRHVICYLDVGAYEVYRSDAETFPPGVLGKPLDGWPGERWLDVRQLATLLPIMRARIEVCASKGFDAVELDDVDGYANDSGFPLTSADQAAYNKALAREVHRRGMSVALKNDLDQIPQLLGSFDFAINEECATYKECGGLAAFTRRGSAVFHVEYGLPTTSFCGQTALLGLSSLRKRLNLGSYRVQCPPVAGAAIERATASGSRITAVVTCGLATTCTQQLQLRGGGTILARKAVSAAAGARATVTFAFPARLRAAVRARSGAVVVVACRALGRGCVPTGRADVVPGA
jgi:hypothetical protein